MTAFRIVLAASVLMPSLAYAQVPAGTPTLAGALAASPEQNALPGWFRRDGEGAFSWRNPRGGTYLIVGGHAGFAQSTTLQDANGCESTNSFFLGCATTRPSDAPGVGGGGSIGVGTRVAPALRVALIHTTEAGYRFRNRTPWVDSIQESFLEDFNLRSHQVSANVYLDIAGLLAPGRLGRWNPYVMAGVGVAVNVAGDVSEVDTLNGFTWINRYPGGTHASFLWTAGAGVQYRIAGGILADLSYQYVDAGRFRAVSGGPQLNGLTGQPFTTPFDPINGNLRTHRVGVAVNIDFAVLGRMFAGP